MAAKRRSHPGGCIQSADVDAGFVEQGVQQYSCARASQVPIFRDLLARVACLRDQSYMRYVTVPCDIVCVVRVRCWHISQGTIISCLQRHASAAAEPAWLCGCVPPA